MSVLKENGEQLLRNYGETAFPPSVTEVAGGIHHVVGYAHSNSIIIEAESSVILIDACETDSRAERLKEIIAGITEKPVKTLIYTHWHPDHRGGAGAFADTVEEVIAFAPMRPMLGRSEELSDVKRLRSTYQFGYCLSDAEVLTQGLGPREGIAVNVNRKVDHRANPKVDHPSMGYER